MKNLCKNIINLLLIVVMSLGMMVSVYGSELVLKSNIDRDYKNIAAFKLVDEIIKKGSTINSNNKTGRNLEDTEFNFLLPDSTLYNGNMDIGDKLGVAEVGPFKIVVSFSDNTATGDYFIHIKDTNCVYTPNLYLYAENFDMDINQLATITKNDIKVQSKVKSWRNNGTWLELKDISVADLTDLKKAKLGDEISIAITATTPNGQYTVTKTVKITVAGQLVQKPNKPTINKIEEGATVIKGKGEPNAIITVTFPNNEIKTTTVLPDGTWSVENPATVTLVIDDIVKVKQTIDNKTSDEATKQVVVVSEVERSPLVLNEIKQYDTTIKGEGTKNDIIEIYINNILVGEATVNKSGAWKFSVPEGMILKASDKVKVKVKGDSIEEKDTVVTLSVPQSPSGTISMYTPSSPSTSNAGAKDPFVYNTTSAPKKQADDSVKETLKGKATTTTKKTLNAVIYAKDINLKAREAFSIMKGVTALDDGGNGKDLTKNITVKGSVNTSKPGAYILTYTVTGENKVTVSRKIRVVVA